MSAGGETAAGGGRPRIFLVEDHAVFRAGVKAELGDAVDVVGEADEAAAATELIGERLPDVVPVLKDQCDRDAPAMALTALPMAAVVAASARLPVPAGERVSVGASYPAPPQRDVEPPTPPPRLASV